ncbi:thioredoxin-like protein [Pseudomassariella vexata]|uniref:Thioredoxin-like protein n=1 Tax=Pseudomassariella vexata TaxID=1141098 RepID=A0A1Y2DQK0_9PEZI|nr:thioredoxin-like protein [Pseudomassariella vexata]ORY61573.1 thioredoxin-like protein [Pseudomassariella vexata]
MGSLGSNDKLILYTNHTCTWANRANVALSELGIPFEERIINVDGPRPPSFLKLNPRGLVPVLIFNDEVIIESAIVCQFLADLHPSSHLCPPPTTTEGALRRAKISFFTDAYWTKFHTHLFRLFEAPMADDEEAVIRDAVAGIVNEVEPLLADAKPFFGGSDKLTLAEVIMGPFVIRAVTLSKHGVYPTSLNAQIEAQTPNFYKWATAVCSHPSITAVFDEEVIVARSRAKRTRMRVAAGLEHAE